MEQSWLGRSYLDLDSDSNLSLYTTRDDRWRQPSLHGSSLRTSEWGASSLGKKEGFLAERKSRLRGCIEGVPVVRLWILMGLILTVILGAIAGGIAGGLVSRRNNLERSVLSQGGTVASSSFPSTGVPITTSSTLPAGIVSSTPTSPLTANTTASTRGISSRIASSNRTSTTAVMPTTSLNSTTPIRSTSSVSLTTSSSPTCTNILVPVTFTDDMVTDFDATIRLIGNVSALGNWTPKLAPVLQYVTYSYWDVTVNLTEGEVVVYKYIIDMGNGTYDWSGSNFTTTKIAGACQTRVPATIPITTPTTIAPQTIIAAPPLSISSFIPD